MTDRRTPVATVILGALVAVVTTACSAGAPPTPSPTPTPPATVAPTIPVAASPTTRPTGPATLSAPDTVGAGTTIEVAWTGPNAQDDYITIVAAGATEWTNEPYFDATATSPQNLPGPTVIGDYEIWYVNGSDDSVAARHPIAVTAFAGSLEAPESVVGGTEFSVEWTGPNGQGDYVTIVEAGAERWTNEDYFYTTEGSPRSLLASTKAGAYEVWYVTGSDSQSQMSVPITVTAPVATIAAPGSVARGDQFEVSWTGPNGPGDYITIVPAGSPSGSYLSYAYTTAGSPLTITAPDAAGPHEVRYVAGDGSTLEGVPITVT